MSKNTKTNPQQIPPATKQGVRTHFDPITEAHLRREAAKMGISVQQYVKELAIQDRLRGKK